MRRIEEVFEQAWWRTFQDWRILPRKYVALCELCDGFCTFDDCGECPNGYKRLEDK
jgi:hypothetical protein